MTQTKQRAHEARRRLAGDKTVTVWLTPEDQAMIRRAQEREAMWNDVSISAAQVIRNAIRAWCS